MLASDRRETLVEDSIKVAGIVCWLLDFARPVALVVVEELVGAKRAPVVRASRARQP